MAAKNGDVPKDLVSLLEDNMKAGRPLLEDAVLYRGSRLPDQTQGSFSSDTMHGTLLPQVAASYTHNWAQGGTAFMGTYKVDREETRFFKDFGMEQPSLGKPAQSMSVKEAEQFLEPLVRDLVSARDSRERGRAEERLESAIKRNLYESNIPTRQADGSPNRPDKLFYYEGRPDVSIRQAVGMQMTRVGPANEAKAKSIMFREARSAAGNRIHQLSSMPGPAQRGLATLNRIVQRDYGAHMDKTHGSLPLNKMLDAISREGQPEVQARVGKFANALFEGATSADKGLQLKAEGLLNRLSQLDPEKSTLQDVAKASAEASRASSQGHGTELGKEKATEAMRTPTTGRSAKSVELGR